jgi:hypothetical protein
MLRTQPRLLAFGIPSSLQLLAQARLLQEGSLQTDNTPWQKIQLSMQ